MDPRPLPPGFISQYDPNTQRWFYVDTRTGVSQWNHPLDVKQYAPPQYPPPPTEQTSQGNHPLGFVNPSSTPSSDQRPPSNYPLTTYGESKNYATNPYATQQQSSSSYPQPTPSNYPSSYLQSGPYGSGPYSNPPDYQANYNPQAQSYVGTPSPSGPPDNKGSNKEHKGMGGMGKMLLGAGLGAAGGLLVGGLAEKKFENQHHHGHHHHGHHHHHHHKGWKGWKRKGWKGWKGKGWKGKGWK